LVHDVELGWEGKGSIFKANVNQDYHSELTHS